MAWEDSIMPDVRLLAAISAGGVLGALGHYLLGCTWQRRCSPDSARPIAELLLPRRQSEAHQGRRADGDLGSAHYMST